MGARRGPSRALTVVGASLSLALALAGCGSGDDKGGPPSEARGSQSTTGVSDGTTGGPTVEVDHRLPGPGPRKGPLHPPDIMVTSDRTIGPEVVAAIKKLEGVASVAQISLGQVLIENHALTVAAVDPRTYRNFTDFQVADTQGVWDRVAGGELAIDKQAARKLPIDRDGYLKLGSTPTSPAIHVGYFAPQAPEIDAVVNTSWIPSLGLTTGNALLIQTGATAPSTLRKPIQRLIGKQTSVQMEDAVARAGLDIHAIQIAIPSGTVADAVGVYHYTVLGGGHIAPDPAWVREHIVTQQVPILGAVTCNKLLFPQLTAALNDVIDQGLADKIHPGQYAGCFYPRFIAGTTTLSNHAFGLALDINAVENQRGTVGLIDRGVVAIFEKWGFTWGGRWHYTDPMHFEMNRLVTPGSISARHK